MTVKSAKSGTVDFGGAVADVTDISVNESGGVKEYASSSSLGKIKRFAGHDDITGSFTVKTDELSITEGDIDILTITSDGSVALVDAVNCIITEVAYSVPIESGEAVEAVVSFGQKLV